jgi:DNA polymerase-3 subunit gamma/tau
VRDALALLEQLMLQAAGERVEVEDVQRLLGLSRNERVEAIVDALSSHRPGDALRVVQTAVDDGEDPRQLNRQLVGYLRMLLVERSGGVESAVDERARQLAAAFALSEIVGHARRFSEIDFTIKHSPFPQLPLEIAIVEASLASEARSVSKDGPVQAAPAAASPARPTSLRDRVRGQQPLRGAGVPDLAPVARAQSATITPFPAPADAEPTPREPDVGGHIDVDLIADLWPNVRADVKALNRRIEALLSEVDPVAVSGNLVTLAVPYPFHRDKLNTDEVRETVAGVLSRLLQRDVSLTCVLRGEFNGVPAKAAPPTADPSPPASDTDAAEAERARMRIQAAKNIFDAEELDDAPLADTVASGDDG